MDFQELLQKIPMLPLLLLFGGYLGYDYYGFQTDPSSMLLQKQDQLSAIKKNTESVQLKVKNAQEFFRNLESRREELRQLALQLDQMKATLSEQVDISAFVRMVVGEARKLGMTVDSIRPSTTVDQEYYTEQNFELKFHGVYVQFVIFLERLASFDRIVRIGHSVLKPVSSPDRTFVQLEGTIELKTYKYRGSKADDLVEKTVPQAQTLPARASPSQPPTPGGGK